jgi:hypothetical protein
MANSVAAVLSESFEDVLGAVQDTARGRWFLDEFSKRNKSQDTTSILAAIGKLESLIGTQAAPVDGAQVQKAREAIAAAKTKLKALHNEIPALSEEARMFAKLAEMSRAALSGDKQAVGRGVDVALSLVDELDQSFSGGAAVAAVKPARETYFAADQDVFETPKVQPVEKPALVEVPKPVAIAPVAAAPVAAVPVEAPKPAKVEDEQPRGAKLTINRVKSADVFEVKPAAVEVAPIVEKQSEPTPVTADAAPAPVASPAPEATAPMTEEKPKSRITIIRRKAEDIVSVPLVDEQPIAAQA